MNTQFTFSDHIILTIMLIIGFWLMVAGVWKTVELGLDAYNKKEPAPWSLECVE